MKSLRTAVLLLALGASVASAGGRDVAVIGVAEPGRWDSGERASLEVSLREGQVRRFAVEVEAFGEWEQTALFVDLQLLDARGDAVLRSAVLQDGEALVSDESAVPEASFVTLEAPDILAGCEGEECSLALVLELELHGEGNVVLFVTPTVSDPWGTDSVRIAAFEEI